MCTSRSLIWIYSFFHGNEEISYNSWRSWFDSRIVHQRKNIVSQDLRLFFHGRNTSTWKGQPYRRYNILPPWINQNRTVNAIVKVAFSSCPVSSVIRASIKVEIISASVFQSLAVINFRKKVLSYLRPGIKISAFKTRFSTIEVSLN